MLMAISLLLGSLTLMTSNPAQAVTTVDHVDLTRYVGQWHEIASIPQWFQKKCVKDVTAFYKALPNGHIEVANSCTTADGSRNLAMGEAKIMDSQSNAKLKVTFAKIFNKFVYLFGGDYWIIDLEENYNYAVIGHPTNEYGWILAHQTSLSDQDLLQISANLKSQGYDTCKFITSIQEGGIQTQMPLCNYLKGK